jgi:hypothetical protein
MNTEVASVPSSFEPAHLLPKASTGISGFDEIAFGGLPKERPTLGCGDAGCGKVDALVIGEADPQDVNTLETADQP